MKRSKINYISFSNRNIFFLSKTNYFLAQKYFFHHNNDNNMIRHVVMWKFKEMAIGLEKPENIATVIRALKALEPKISEIKSLEVGKNFNPADVAFDLVLISTHEHKEALKGYIDHPFHKEVAAFIGELVAERKVVDFEY